MSGGTRWMGAALLVAMLGTGCKRWDGWCAFDVATGPFLPIADGCASVSAESSSGTLSITMEPPEDYHLAHESLVFIDVIKLHIPEPAFVGERTTVVMTGPYDGDYGVADIEVMKPHPPRGGNPGMVEVEVIQGAFRETSFGYGELRGTIWALY